MVEPNGAAIMGATALAAMSAAALICALFYPILFRPALSGQRSAIFEALLKGRAPDAVPVTRIVRRAQDSALRSVAEHGKQSHASRVNVQLASAGLNWSAGQYLGLCSVFAAAILAMGLALQFNVPAALMIALLAATVVPQRYLDFRARRRKQAFLIAFAAAVDMIVRGAKSGLSLMDCLAIVAADGEEPVRREFALILAQLKAGVPLAAAMEKLAAAMPAAEVRFFVLIMGVQSQTGGNLTEALGNLAGVLRDRQKLAAKVRIASAEVRASALVIGALPFAVIGATTFFAPNYIAMLWTDDAGRRLAGFCAVWLAAGVLVLRRMARIEP